MRCTRIARARNDAWGRCYDCTVDVETAEAIERLTERIDGFESSVRAELGNGLAELRVELRGELAKARAELRDELAEVRVELRDGLAEVRRHSVMLNETTRDDIRLVAEAVAAVAIKIDSLQR